MASKYPARNMTGGLIVSDRPLQGGACSVSLPDDSAVRAFLEIPWELVQEEPGRQKKALSRLLSEQASKGTSDDGLSLPEGALSRCAGRHVQFIHSQSLFEERERRFRAVPPAAFCMAPALQKRGFQLSVDTVLLEPFFAPDLSPAHLVRESRDRIDRILEKKPLCIAVTAMDFYLEELSCLLKEIRARDEEVWIAVGGPLVTLYPEKAPVYLEEGNIFIRGEADFAFAEVLQRLCLLRAERERLGRGVSLFENQAGLFLRFGDTVLASHLDRTVRVGSLDEIFPEEPDLGFIEKRHLAGGFHLHTTRGCPFRCSFCAKVHGSRVRAMSHETIFRLLSSYRQRVEEIRRTEGLSEKERVQALQVSLSDDDFLLDRSRAKAFFIGMCDVPFRLKTVPAGIPSFLSQGGDGTRRFDPALLEAIDAAKTRIRSFEIGTDDFSDRELSRLAKGGQTGYSLREIEEVARRFEALGISNRHFLILSNPDTQWSDLFEKLILLEYLCRSYTHFFPDPNPFVIAPAGTPLFADLARQGRVDRLTKKTFEVPDFPELTHWAFNMATPREDLFSSGRSPFHHFFRRLCDLLKSRCRFSVLDDAYLHYLDVCGTTGFGRLEEAERQRVLEQLTAAVRMRAGRILSGIRDESLRSDDALANNLSGMFLLRATLRRAFPEPRFRESTDGLLKILEAFFEEVERGSKIRTRPTSPLSRELDQALRFGRNQVRLHLCGGCADPVNPLPVPFAQRIEERLEAMGLGGEAREWRELCSAAARFVRLEITEDGQNAGFAEDEAGLDRFFGLLKIVDPALSRRGDALRFLRGEQVLSRSIQEDILTTSDARVFVYNGIERLPLRFKERVQEAFRISSFLDRDGFARLVLSKFLTSRATAHVPEMHGTDLFQGLEEALESLVPRPLEVFSKWFFSKG